MIGRVAAMDHDWLLVETLGEEPAVVACGVQLQNLVPLATFLRRDPHLAAIQIAITETVQTGESLASITAKHRQVIRTEPVKMSDGRVHGVQVWHGPTDAEPPERPLTGAMKWDLTLGAATDTPESLTNVGKNLQVEDAHGRAFAESLPSRDLFPYEDKIVALVIKAEPGRTLCSSWDVTDEQDNPVRVNFVARNAIEPGPNGRSHLIARGMNWRGEPEQSVLPPDRLAQQVLDALAQPGVHRALVDLNSWALLKWLDEPSPFYTWPSPESGEPRVHPDDEPLMDAMRAESSGGPTAGVLRLNGPQSDWVPLHVTVNHIDLEDIDFDDIDLGAVDLDENVSAGLVALRLPTIEELADAGLN